MLPIMVFSILDANAVCRGSEQRIAMPVLARDRHRDVLGNQVWTAAT